MNIQAAPRVIEELFEEQALTVCFQMASGQSIVGLPSLADGSGRLVVHLQGTQDFATLIVEFKFCGQCCVG
ncbi:hypothetical protein D3C86_993520 [compost metagenome]